MMIVGQTRLGWAAFDPSCTNQRGMNNYVPSAPVILSGVPVWVEVIPKVQWAGGGGDIIVLCGPPEFGEGPKQMQG